MSISVHCQSKKQSIRANSVQELFAPLPNQLWLMDPKKLAAVWVTGDLEKSSIIVFVQKSGYYAYLSLILRVAEGFFVSAVVGTVGTPSEAGSGGAGVERGSNWNLKMKYF